MYVGGGSLISLLGTWTAHGIDLMLRAAWEHGVVMAGPERRLAVLVRPRR